MNNEIKEILELYKKEDIEYYNLCSDLGYDKLLDYITNLQEENEELKLLCQTQNNREYRSKFLKDFQKEHGKNVFPDYDEIYKRYDNFKSRNEKAIEYIKDSNILAIYKLDYFIEDLISILQGEDKDVKDKR